MRPRFLLLSLLALTAAASLQAQDRSTRFGLKAILLFPGEGYVEESNRFFDIDMSFGGGAFVDTRLGERLLGGVYADVISAQAFDESGILLDVGVALKATLGGKKGKLSWRPNIGIGFGNLAETGGVAASQYLTLRGGVELVFPGGWLVEGSLYGSPTGGNDDLTVTYGPMAMIRLGRLF